MKVGIITHHWVPNFGANLQALATFNLLKNMGHEPIIINYRPQQVVELYEGLIHEHQLNVHEEFLDKFQNGTRLCTTSEEVERLNEEYSFDYLISGSDAVFRLNHNSDREDKTFPNPFWLTFANSGQKKLFFSVSSMGSDFSKLKPKTKGAIVKALKDSKILVRDRWTHNQLLSLDNSLNVDQSIDPVFLLNKNFKIPDEYSFKSTEKYILLNLYSNMFSENWIKKFVKICNLKGYKVYVFPNPEGNYVGKDITDGTFELPIHPLTWYSILQKSSGYLGVRFHPIVTSISNKIPFLSIDTYQKNLINRMSSKTFDICKKVGAKKYCISPLRRRFLSPQRALKLLLDNGLDYDFIDSEINKIEKIFESIK